MPQGSKPSEPVVEPAKDVKPARGRRPKKPVTDEDVAEIQRLYHEDRLSIRAVVKETGFSLWQVRQAIGDTSRTLSEAAPRVVVHPQSRETILQLRREGLTYKEIAAQVEHPRVRVTRVVQEGLDDVAHAAVVKRICKRPAFDYDRIIELSDLGLSKVEIAQVMECSVNTVAKARREAGWKYRQK